MGDEEGNRGYFSPTVKIVTITEDGGQSLRANVFLADLLEFGQLETASLFLLVR